MQFLNISDSPAILIEVTAGPLFLEDAQAHKTKFYLAIEALHVLTP